MAKTYDAVLVVSFGGPEGMDEVMPFLRNVLRGRNVPEARMHQVAHHYEQFGGVSPLNAQNRALVDALERELAAHGMDLPVYWGNRNWHPLLEDTIQEMADDGIQDAIAFVTSAYSSYSGCRQYRQNFMAAQANVGVRAPNIDKLRVFYNHPGFIEPNIDFVRTALQQVSEERRTETPVLFTAHSIPSAMAATSRYESQLQEASRLVAEGVGHENWRLVWQSRSGPPSQPWLEPDVCDVIAELADAGATDVVISPIGFTSDHMEVIYDLDTEAVDVAREHGVRLVRAATVGADPRFIAMIRELIQDRMSEDPLRRALGRHGASHDVCPPGCCAYPAPRVAPEEVDREPASS